MMPKFWDRTSNRQDRTSNFSAKPKKLKIAWTKIISRKKWDWKKWEQKIGPQKFVITRQESSFALLKKNFQMYLRYLLISWQKMGLFTHSNDSHQCPILAADFVIFYYGTENEEAIQAGAGSEWGIEVGYSFSIPKQVSCQYGTLMWIIAVTLLG